MGNTDLQKAQARLLDRLNAIPAIQDFQFYLAGGTGLHFYLQHRVSIDEDFFTQKEFDSSELLLILRQHFRVTEHQASKGTLHCFIDKVKCSFFHYPYPLLNATTPVPFPTASILDIATMKLAAIVGRGAKKDFYDLYSILQNEISFEAVWQAYEKKFSRTHEDLYPVIKSLTYFDDAEAELLGLTNEKRNWKEVKAYFISLSRQLFIDGIAPKE